MNSIQRTGITSLAISLLALIILPGVLQAQISIVVSSSSDRTADASFLKQVFSGTRFSWPDGDKIVVVDQPGTPVSEAFYDKFVGRSVSEVRKTWMRSILSGEASAPVKCANDEEVKIQLTGKPMAIGFIATSSLDGTVREIYRVR